MSGSHERKTSSFGFGRTFGTLALCGFLAACSLGSIGGREPGRKGPVSVSPAQEKAYATRFTSEGFDGLVLADEPQAAEAANAILRRGGTAADAAAALYFTLAVTYSSDAGLGGGGLCLIYTPDGRRAMSLDFLPRDSQKTGFAAVPGNVAGFYELHRRYGRLPWNELLARGIRFADDGQRISHAFARRIAAAKAVLRDNPDLNALFVERGKPLREGDKLRQRKLAETLESIALRGPQGFYQGRVAETLIADAGGRLSLEEFSRVSPVHVRAAVDTLGGRAVYLPATRTGSGAFLQALLAQLKSQQTEDAADFRRIARNVLDSFKAPALLPPDFGSTSFFVLSRAGDAVACGVTMNGPFGSGRMSVKTGVVYARAPSLGPLGLGGAFLTPLIMTRADTGRVIVMASGAGSSRASAAAAYTAHAVRPATGRGLADAIAENGSGPLDLVNAVACTGTREQERCELAPDPNGSGLAIEAAIGNGR